MSGTSGNDFLILGDGYGQTLDGLAGNDTLVAGGGSGQQLYGGNDADSLQGGDGFQQLLRGDDGADEPEAVEADEAETGPARPADDHGGRRVILAGVAAARERRRFTDLVLSRLP